MSAANERIPKPPNLADRYPLREYDVVLNDLIGWTRDQVLSKLSKPNSQGPGARWSSDTSIDHKTFIRDYSGKIIQIYVFGVTPQKIPVGDPYEEWVYHNVRGSTWLLFFVKSKVFEVAQYPTGAVF